jgi:hypothetical protein
MNRYSRFLLYECKCFPFFIGCYLCPPLGSCGLISPAGYGLIATCQPTAACKHVIIATSLRPPFVIFISIFVLNLTPPTFPLSQSLCSLCNCMPKRGRAVYASKRCELEPIQRQKSMIFNCLILWPLVHILVYTITFYCIRSVVEIIKMGLPLSYATSHTFY